MPRPLDTSQEEHWAHLSKTSKRIKRFPTASRRILWLLSEYGGEFHEDFNIGFSRGIATAKTGNCMH